MSRRVSIRVATDCSGIEAPIQALKQLKIKHKHIFSSDIDPYCRQSISANYSPDILYDDMTSRDLSDTPIDLYVCGFPCQSFSMAGRRKGMTEKRGQIFWYCLDVIEQKRPAVFVLENVKGLISIDEGKTFEKIIKSLENVGDNGNKLYNVQWKVLNTKDYGIPQNRERVFIVGTRKDKRYHFSWPSPKKMKPLDSFVDWDDDVPKETVSSRVTYMEKRVPKDSIFIDLAFKQATYPNSDRYTPSVIRNGSLWCVPLQRYANMSELLALQGFPRSFKQVVSNSQLKKQIGNSMSVCVLKEIFKQLYM